MARGKETRAKYKNPRYGYTFTFEQKQQALENDHYQCEYCGKFESLKNHLEGHHILAIWFARETGIPAQVIIDSLNLAMTCHDCHVKLHSSEDRYHYAIIARFIFGLDVDYNESKDDWRKDPNHPINKGKML